MKLSNVLLSFAILLTLGRTTPAQPGKPPQQSAIAQVLDSWISNAETHVMPVAEVMPGDKYSFVPAESSGEFNAVRTFAQQLKHLAANDYWMAALMLGNKGSSEMYSETGPDSVRTKAEIVEYVKGSFAVDAVAHSFDHYGQLVEYLRMNGIVPPDSRPKRNESADMEEVP